MSCPLSRRFFPDGTMLYRTTPNTVSKVARSLRYPKPTSCWDEHIFHGRYIIRGHKVSRLALKWGWLALS